MIARFSVLLALPLAALGAQEPAAEKPDIAKQDIAKPDIAKIERQFTEAQKKWNEAYRAASVAKDKDKLAELRKQRPEGEFVARCLAGAKAGAGTDAAVPFLAWVVTHGELEVAKNALTTLLDQHVANPGIAGAVARLGGLHTQLGLEQTRKWLDLVLEKNAAEPGQAQARFTRAGLYVGTRAAARSEPLRHQAIADLQYVEEHGTASLKTMAASLRKEAEQLEPGLIAPEISGEDLDGVQFKLSDYRGKVVLLDFWGDW